MRPHVTSAESECPVSGLAHGEWDSPEIRRILEVRDSALTFGDPALVKECDASLARLGLAAGEDGLRAVSQPKMERAVPTKGQAPAARPPKSNKK